MLQKKRRLSSKCTNHPQSLFFAHDAFQVISCRNFTHIHITSLFTCTFFQFFLKLRNSKFIYFFQIFWPPWRQSSKTPHSSWSNLHNLIWVNCFYVLSTFLAILFFINKTTSNSIFLYHLIKKEFLVWHPWKKILFLHLRNEEAVTLSSE